MQTLGAASYGEYVRVLEKDPGEMDRLFDAVLINVTAFFRDSMPWEYLAERVVPDLLSKKAPGASIRAWSAGCATGQEAFTLAMILAEALGSTEFVRRVKIYATDLDEDALAYARQGSYTEQEIEAVPAPLLEKYFQRDGERYVFRKDIRRVVVFGRNDLVLNAPISRIDILCCRNTLMYFDAATQTKIIQRFHFALNDGGYLLVGKAETLATHSSLFTPVDLQRRVFAKISRDRGVERQPVNSRHESTTDAGAYERGAMCDAAFEKSIVAQFVVNRDGKLVLANERARAVFRLAPADIGRSLHDLEMSSRPVDLRSLIDQLYVDERPVQLVEVPWAIGGEDRSFDVHLLPLFGAKRGLVGVAIAFTDVTTSRNLKHELQRAHAEQETAYQELQSTNEELETTNEELQSTVEELETTKRELQSTNQEMETMNEELHSTNEELNSSNEELHRRSDAVTTANRFLETVLGSLTSAVAVVDRELRVLRWNRQAEELWGLRADEVRGQHLLNLDIGLPVDQLRAPLRSCVSDGGEHTISVPAINRRGRAVACDIRCIPLGSDGDLQGAVIMIDAESAEAPARP